MTRRRLLALAAAGALALAALLAALFVQDADDYRAELAALLGEALGHPVTVAGPLGLRWQPSPAITARDVSVDAPGAAVHIQTLRVSVDSGALMARRLVVNEVLADGVQVSLAGAPLAALTTALPSSGAPPALRVELRAVSVGPGGDGHAPWLGVDRIALGELAHPDGARLELETQEPRVRGRARLAVRDGALQLDAIQVDSVFGPLEGRLAVGSDGGRPRVTGRLRASALALPAPGLPRHVADPGVLARLDARIQLQVGRLSVGGWRLSEVELPLRVRDGALELNAAGVLAGGPLSLDLSLRAPAGSGPLAGRLAIALRQADAGETLVMAGVHGAERGGRLDVQARLEVGGDGAGLLARLGGDLSVDARGLTLRASAAELAASDVYAGLMRVLRGKRGNRVGLECATARIAVREGVLRSDAGLAVQSQDINAVGGGELSLARRNVDIRLRPWPRPGLGPSARAVADEVAIRGDLDAPSVRFLDDAADDPDGGPLRTRLRERARGDAPCERPGSTVPVDAWS